ncbi:MAG: ankyrin repeat domain-containing protein [Bacteroidota bacterium]
MKKILRPLLLWMIRPAVAGIVISANTCENINADTFPEPRRHTKNSAAVDREQAVDYSEDNDTCEREQAEDCSGDSATLEPNGSSLPNTLEALLIEPQKGGFKKNVIPPGVDHKALRQLTYTLKNIPQRACDLINKYAGSGDSSTILHKFLRCHSKDSPATDSISLLLLQAGGDPNNIDLACEGCTALHLAIKNEHPLTLAYLLQDGSNVKINAQDIECKTALHYMLDLPSFTADKELKVFERLLQLGANPKVGRPIHKYIEELIQKGEAALEHLGNEHYAQVYGERDRRKFELLRKEVPQLLWKYS